MPPTVPASSFGAAALNFTQSLLVVCCNGALPFVDLHVWPINGATFHPLDPTDWVVTQTAGSHQLNVSLQPEVENVSGLHLPENIDLSICQAYNSTFASRKLRNVFLARNGTVSCECPRQYYGTSCHLVYPMPLHRRTAHSFRIFLFLAIIPLSFALFAVIGGFMCKVCCIDCFNISCGSCSGKDRDIPVYEDSLPWGVEGDNSRFLDENTYNRCLETARMSQKPKKSYSTATTVGVRENGETCSSRFIPAGTCPGSTTNGYAPVPPEPPPYNPEFEGDSPPPSYGDLFGDSPPSMVRTRPPSDATTQTILR